MRHRACAALIKNNQILMVRLETNDRSFWTLPGGGLEENETFEQAVIREVQEEVNLAIRIIKPLYSETHANGQEICFLVRQIDSREPILGYDPERLEGNQVLTGVRWTPLSEMTADRQVAKILTALGYDILFL